NGSFTYTPVTGYIGSDSFSFKVNDGTVNSADALVSIQVTAPVNHAPVAASVNIGVVLNTQYVGTLTATDADGNSLTFAAGSTAAAHGTVQIATSGTFTYTPNTGYLGSDSFSFKVNDGTVNSADAVVSIQVTAVPNHAPVATAASIHTVLNTTYAGTLTGTDADGNNLTFAAGSISAAHGIVVINPNGAFTYTPLTGYTGSDSFSFKVNDGIVNSADATVVVQVTPTNTAPVATATSIHVIFSTPYSGTLTGTDADGDPLTFSAGSTIAAHGTVQIAANGTFTYTPATNYIGSDSFSFKVNDGTVNSADALVSVQVLAPVNHAPIATPTSITVILNTQFSGGLSGTDADGDTLTFAAGSTSASHGTVVINTNGTFTYTPAAGYTGSDAFSFQVNDGTVSSANATVTVHVASATNRAPVAITANINVAFNTQFSGALSGTDADGDTLTFLAGNIAAAHGTVVINPNGAFTYTPASGYTGSDAFSFRVNDGTVSSANATVAVHVASVTNRAPVAITANINVAFNTQFSGGLSGTDADGDTLTFLAGNIAAAHGTVVINPNGAFTYTPASGYTGSDTFSFKVNDGTVDSSPATVTVHVADVVNTTPIANPATITTIAGVALNGTLTGSDADGDHLIFLVGTTTPAHGTLDLNTNGQYVYTPNAGFVGNDFFTFKVNDGTINSSSAAVIVRVQAANAAPIVSTGAGSVTANVAFDGSVSALSVDPDGDPLTFAVVAQPTHGTLTLSPDGTFVYTPDTDYVGADSFNFKANDGSLDSNVGTFNLTVSAASTGFDVTLTDNPGTIATQVQNVTPLDTTAELVNVDPAVTFANAVLTTSITSGAGRGDRFVVTSGGTIEIRGKHIRINGIEVARISGGGSGQALQVTFNSSASADSVQAVMQRIGLQTTRKSASTQRVVRFTVNADGFSSSDTMVANKV
ncbi:MAG: outer rane adhesin like protein, partial [Planctomycetaceae bacterium]|nr:outer rane adhesin like protein [Planctomycetaceae bacterium]